MPVYTWLTLQEAVDALQGRLANSTFWTQAELIVYINESLRLWNALTEQWNQDFIYNSSPAWTNTGAVTGSPRLRTVTSDYLYTQMQYMLLEPPTGGAWTGTSQFSISDIQFALAKRTTELIQATNCNLTNFPLASTPNTRRVQLPDTILEPQRVRFLPNVTIETSGYGEGGYGEDGYGEGGNLYVPPDANANTLTREDTQAFQYFEPQYLQTEGVPKSWSVSSEPPLAFDVDIAPSVVGIYDFIGLQDSPTSFTGYDEGGYGEGGYGGGTSLGIPDDFTMVAMYGALADLLGRESEATDHDRAAYCLKRFTDGIAIMNQSNWLLQASLNGVPTDTPAMFEMDSYAPEWQNGSSMFPAVVQGGMDFVNVASARLLGYGEGGFGEGGFGGSSEVVSVSLTLVANAPLPVGLDDFVQVSRDAFDVVLSYAQRLAAFKMGGAEWAATAILEHDFMRAAAATNKRLLNIGIFDDVLHSQGRRQQMLVPR